MPNKHSPGCKCCSDCPCNSCTRPGSMPCEAIATLAGMGVGYGYTSLCNFQCSDLDGDYLVQPSPYTTLPCQLTYAGDKFNCEITSIGIYYHPSHRVTCDIQIESPNGFGGYYLQRIYLAYQLPSSEPIFNCRDNFTLPFLSSTGDSICDASNATVTIVPTSFTLTP